MTNKIQFILTIVLFSIIFGCKKDNINPNRSEESYFENLIMLESLDGGTNLDLNSSLIYTFKEGYCFVIIELFDSLGRFLGERTITDHHPDYKIISLAPLLQNKKYFYRIKLTDRLCLDPPICWEQETIFAGYMPKIYSFRTKKIDSVNLVKDSDGNIYETVKIGQQEWFAQNLRTQSNYDDYFEKKSIKKYPYFSPWPQSTYSYDAIKNTNNICPEGWRLPNVSDFEQLFDVLKDKYGSQYPNEYDFKSSNRTYLSFDKYSNYNLWTSTRESDSIIYFFNINTYNPDIGEYGPIKRKVNINDPTDYFYEKSNCIRCIKDSTVD